MAPASAARNARSMSSSTEHYLRAILELREERGYARVVDIATRVGVTKGTVSLTLNQLERRGLIRFDAARFPVLTPTGRRVAADVRGRFTIVQAFLTHVIGVPAARAAAEACRWEHVVSHEVADRLLDLVRFADENAAFGRQLATFHRFHRRCAAGAECSTCAARGPVETFCSSPQLVPLTPRKPS